MVMMMVAKRASVCLFLFLLFSLIICSSGSLVGFSYHARTKSAASSTTRTISFLQLNKVPRSQVRIFVTDHTVLTTLSNSSIYVDLHLNESFFENLRSSNSYASAWLKTHLLPLLPHVKLKTIILTHNDFGGQTELVKLFSTLKSIHSLLRSFNLHKEVTVSAAFSSPFLQRMKNSTYRKELHKVFDFIKKTRSFVIVEEIINGQVSMGDQFVQAVIKAANLATSFLPCHKAPIFLTIKSLAVPSAAEVAEFTSKVENFIENNIEVTTRIAALYVEVPEMKDLVEKKLDGEKEQSFVSSHRQLLGSIKKIAHDDITIPTTPPASFPPNNPTPTVVNVPATNPVTITPTNPADMPTPIPSTTPVTVPSTNPNNPTVPITNPVTTPAPITVPGGGAQPVTNPVTTYPAPTGGVPVSTPVTNPVPPPATTTNAPAIPGQSWCVARTGASETSLQAGLDYACGIGGADCSQIQQGASCYNPNTIQNHASYAFNSYYQKIPSPTSCDFGGTAAIVNTNPSSGSCIFPSSASQSTPTTTTTPTVTPGTTSGAGVPGSVTPPTVLNSGAPASSSTSVFGTDTPPGVSSTSTSMSAGLQPFIRCIILLTSFVCGVIFLDV